MTNVGDGVFSMIVAWLAFLFWCVYLGLEGYRLHGWRGSIPLRISVSGTRGKTTLVRLLASVLRESGRIVLAKTTGTQALLVLPDGSEEPVRRGRIPSILEQISFLRRGAELAVDTVVAEVMSVHAENHRVESQGILRPNMVLMTNFRLDHTEAVGSTREEVAALHLQDVPPGARVFLPQGESLPEFRQGVEEVGGILELVPPEGHEMAFPEHISEGLDLVWALCRSLEIPDAVISRGISSAKGDEGELWIRRYAHGSGAGTALTANAFAANDPESTGLALDRIRSRLAGWGGGPGPSQGKSTDFIGILNLRRDRRDRTHQWVEALGTGALGELKHLFVVGFHGRAVLGRLARIGWEGRAHLLKEKDPARATEEILARAGSEAPLLFGFGNMEGMGADLADHWRRSGRLLMEEHHGA
jgi:poly-gamma-glutamate synthase PgsB/CapB